ncbi:FMN-binding negative transcriptional regulator [Kytococcus sedentarius]|uniref:FMN-binding negative transcriptional regulator n=1 Tax=Kytococcus sedentarius TaxID=1276 RepID=UPI003850A371
MTGGSTLVFPHDAARDEAEWREWLDGPDLFGVLAVNNREATGASVLVPTHATLRDDEILLHLARVNPVFEHLGEDREVLFQVVGAVAYVPGPWRAAPEVPSEHGVPTSYYSAVQFRCSAEVVDDPAGTAEILAVQLADLQPEGGSAPVHADAGPYARMLPAVRGLRLHVLEVSAKFKYDDEKSVEHRMRVNALLDERARPGDRAAARRQRQRWARD